MKVGKCLRGLVSGLIFVNLIACNRAPLAGCDKHLNGIITSSDHKFKAAILRVECGATTSDADWVLLAPINQEFDPDLDRVAVFDDGEVQLNWRDDGLVINYHDAKSFLKLSTAKGIKIIYKRNPEVGGN